MATISKSRRGAFKESVAIFIFHRLSSVLSSQIFISFRFKQKYSLWITHSLYRFVENATTAIYKATIATSFDKIGTAQKKNKDYNEFQICRNQ